MDKAAFISSIQLGEQVSNIPFGFHHQKSHITDVASYGEFKDAVEHKPGFIRAMWCGDVECENKIKEDTTATSRCMPLEGEETVSDVCVCCGKPAHKLVYWGKAY